MNIDYLYVGCNNQLFKKKEVKNKNKFVVFYYGYANPLQGVEIILKSAKLLEDKNDDSAIGELLGYPKCCIDFFMKNKEKQQKLQNDYILPALSNSEGFEFSYYNNYAIRYFDITLLSHFPHNFNCKESKDIAKNNLQCIKNESDELTIKFETMLKCPVLYTENNGIFKFENHTLNDNILEFKNVKSTINNELLKSLNENKKFEIINKNKIKLNNELIEDIGFMLFTLYKS